jgi:hypothetical protein
LDIQIHNECWDLVRHLLHTQNAPGSNLSLHKAILGGFCGVPVSLSLVNKDFPINLYSYHSTLAEATDIIIYIARLHTFSPKVSKVKSGTLLLLSGEHTS